MKSFWSLRKNYNFQGSNRYILLGCLIRIFHRQIHYWSEVACDCFFLFFSFFFFRFLGSGLFSFLSSKSLYQFENFRYYLPSSPFGLKMIKFGVLFIYLSSTFISLSTRSLCILECRLALKSNPRFWLALFIQIFFHVLLPTKIMEIAHLQNFPIYIYIFSYLAVSKLQELSLMGILKLLLAFLGIQITRSIIYSSRLDIFIIFSYT